VFFPQPLLLGILSDAIVRLGPGLNLKSLERASSLQGVPPATLQSIKGKTLPGLGDWPEGLEEIAVGTALDVAPLWRTVILTLLDLGYVRTFAPRLRRPDLQSSRPSFLRQACRLRSHPALTHASDPAAGKSSHRLADAR
jgi:hypothetical protein